MPLTFDLIVTREQGKVIPAWRHAFPVRLQGVRVVVEHQYERELSRYLAQARVFNPPAGMKVPNPIWDAKLLDLKPERLVLAGFERVTDEVGVVRDYAQSWVLIPTAAGP